MQEQDGEASGSVSVPEPPSLSHKQSYIIAYSQGLTNEHSGRDYRVLTISLFYVQNKYITTWNIKIDKI